MVPHAARGDAKRPHERAAHPLAIAEPRFARDLVHRKPALLDHHPRRLYAQPLDRLGGGLAGLRMERAAELARAQPRGARQLLDRKPVAQMRARMRQRILDPV